MYHIAVSLVTLLSMSVALTAQAELTLTFGWCRLGKGIVLNVTKYRSEQQFEFPRDKFRVSIADLPLIKERHLDNPHFWHRNRRNTEFHYCRCVQQSGPVKVIVNTRHHTIAVRLYNYANVFLNEQPVPITIQMGDETVTSLVWFDNLGKPVRIHHKHDPVGPTQLYVRRMRMLTSQQVGDIAIQGCLTMCEANESALPLHLACTVGDISVAHDLLMCKKGCKYACSDKASSVVFKYNQRSSWWNATIRKVALPTIAPDACAVPASVALKIGEPVMFNDQVEFDLRVLKKSLVKQ